MKKTKMKAEKVENKKHFDLGKNIVRIIALLLAIMMVFAASGTVIYFIVLSANGLI